MQHAVPPARKRFGQHFLSDRSAVRRIVEILDPHPSDPVLEIGPGRGALTEALLDSRARVVGVEFDRDLASHLRRRFSVAGLVVVEGDILTESFERIATDLDLDVKERFLVAGNLPYNISKPVATKMVEERGRVRRAVLMFQREVAERICAGPGSRSYAPLTVLVRQAYRVRIAFHLPPGAFRPRPAVTSTVTEWIPVEAPIDDEALMRLRACLAACFSARRKTLRNNLRGIAPGGESQVRAILQEAGIDPGSRPEQVPPEKYVRLSGAFPLV